MKKLVCLATCTVVCLLNAEQRELAVFQQQLSKLTEALKDVPQSTIPEAPTPPVAPPLPDMSVKQPTATTTAKKRVQPAATKSVAQQAAEARGKLKKSSQKREPSGSEIIAELKTMFAEAKKITLPVTLVGSIAKISAYIGKVNWKTIPDRQAVFADIAKQLRDFNPAPKLLSKGVSEAVRDLRQLVDGLPKVYQGSVVQTQADLGDLVKKIVSARRPAMSDEPQEESSRKDQDDWDTGD